MEENLNFKDIMGISAAKEMFDIFANTGLCDPQVAVCASVTFFTQFLFLLESDYRSKLMSILDELSVLMNETDDHEEFFEKMKAFDIKSRLEALSI